MTKPRNLTPTQAEQARQLYGDGMRIRAISRKLGCGENAVADALFGAPVPVTRSSIHPTQFVRIPDEAIAERDHRMTLEQQSLTALLMGDPLPGYSALDRR